MNKQLTMRDELQALLEESQKKIDQINSLQELDQLRVSLLGKKGRLTEVLKSLGQLPQEERIQLGQVVNTAKDELNAAIKSRMEYLLESLLQKQLASEKLDVTLPGRKQKLGEIHPVTRVKQRVEELFKSAGFSVVEGNEIENDYYNFAALNIPEQHPARAMHDTFYLENGLLLRTHTSPVQIHIMESQKPPLKIITPGKVYRCDSDQTHTPMFHQVEGLVVDEHCTFANLKDLLQQFFNQFFEKELPARFRPSYFPFTEPSAEMDIQCVQCEGEGCRICKGTGWLEVLGCGMVHPNVLNNVGIDPEKYSGFAFGLGLDRLAMLRYKIDDLRRFFENDLRFLSVS